jgi:hypothetical protein
VEDVVSACDVEALITSAPPGSVTFSKFEFFDQEGRTRGLEVAFLIREESKRIRHLGHSVIVEVRAALMERNGVGLIPILIGINPTVRSYRYNVFETWLNFHAPRLDGSKDDCLETLCKQDRIPILFYSGSGMERSVQISNSRLKPTWSNMLAQVSHMNAWGMRDFDLARDLLRIQHPTVRSLWNSLKLQVTPTRPAQPNSRWL